MAIINLKTITYIFDMNNKNQDMCESFDSKSLVNWFKNVILLITSSMKTTLKLQENS